MNIKNCEPWVFLGILAGIALADLHTEWRIRRDAKRVISEAERIKYRVW